MMCLCIGVAYDCGEECTHTWRQNIKRNTGGTTFFVFFFCFKSGYLLSLVTVMGRGRTTSAIQCKEKKELLCPLFVFIIPLFFQSGSACILVCFQSLLCSNKPFLLSLWTVYNGRRLRHENIDLAID